jgi:hypothetical protein
MTMHDAKSNPSESFDDFDFVDLYATSNFTEIDILSEVLADNHIAFIVRDMSTPQFPIAVGKHSEMRLAVEETKIGEATELINLAIRDEAIAGEGSFMMP